MSGWTLIRFLHLVGVAFFVGGQLVLLVAVTPVLRRGGDDTLMRAIARRFGIGSVAALGVIVATGIAMASHLGAWDRPVLQAKLAVIVLIGVLTGLHIASAKTRALSIALVVSSLVVVWLGVELAHG
jgi:putative copper export protein